jgi:hypothetical protein
MSDSPERAYSVDFIVLGPGRMPHWPLGPVDTVKPRPAANDDRIEAIAAKDQTR